jgi:hypothetical protein
VTQEELDQILERAQKGEATLGDVVNIVGATIMSVARHARDIKARQDEAQQKLDAVSARLAKVESYTSDWVYRAVIEDPLEDAPADSED